MQYEYWLSLSELLDQYGLSREYNTHPMIAIFMCDTMKTDSHP
jgi:hypothetical protein